MSTRLYLTKRPPGTFLQGPPHGSWSSGESTRENRGINNHWTFLAATTKDSGGTAQTTSQPDDEVVTAGILFQSGRWVTNPLDSLSISGTFNMCVAFASSIMEDNQWQLHIYITDGDTLDVKTVLVDNYIVDMDPTPTGFSGKFFQLDVAATLSAGTIDPGDRIAIELGVVIPTANLPNSYSLAFGTTDSGNSNLSDSSPGDTDFTAKASWFQFSANLVELAAPAAPANDACADATAIASIPFQDSAIDTTTSTDPAGNKSIWYSWTASFTGIVIATAIRCNYNNTINAYTGGCGGLTPVGLDGGVNAKIWLGVGQSIAEFSVTSGTAYLFEIASHSTNSTNQALKCGGSMSFGLFQQQTTPADDDIYVSCQHVVAYRNGVLINDNSNFYNNTPTGMSIDYTLRPLDDLNGGTNTELRLYFCLFGDFGIVEIINISNFCHDTDEVDFFSDSLESAPSTPNRGQNLASIIFDLLGNIYLGWFGDGYSVIGGLSTSESCGIRVIDGTHADNQAGAPWPNADTYLVNQDVGGSNYLDLAVDQDTIYYTSSGTKIKVFSISGNMNLPDFATVTNAAGPRPGTRGLRLLPPGDGTGGMLVANGSEIVRLDGAGAVVSTYTPPDPLISQDIDKVEISKDKTTFWASDQLSTRIYHFNLATTALIDTIETNLPAGQLSGFAIYNGYRAAISPPSPPGTGTIIVIKTTNPSGSMQEFDFTATGLTPDTFTLTDGTTQTYTDLTPGSGYSVNETPVDGWETTYDVSNGTKDAIVVVADETTTVNVLNTIIISKLSGMYQIVPEKTNDTLWLQFDPKLTRTVKIP